MDIKGTILNLFRSNPLVSIIVAIILIGIVSLIFYFFPIPILVFFGLLGLSEKGTTVKKRNEEGEVIDQYKKEMNIFGTLFLIIAAGVFAIGVMLYNRFSKRRDIQLKRFIKPMLVFIPILVAYLLATTGSFKLATTTLFASYVRTNAFLFLFIPFYLGYILLRKKVFKGIHLNFKDIELDDLKSPARLKSKVFTRDNSSHSSNDIGIDPESGSF